MFVFVQIGEVFRYTVLILINTMEHYMSFEAVVFPGQGAQKRGMASDFYDQFEAAQQVFDTANKHLNFDVKAMCFEDKEELNQTVYTQPSIVTAEIAMFNSLKSQHDNFAPSFFAGHSLGEYTALVAAEVLSVDVAIQLVAKRGQLMHETAVNGAMAAVIMDNLPLTELTDLAHQFDIDMANDNSSTQVVLSGDKAKLEDLVAQIESHYSDVGVRCIMLNVSAPFHSRYMEAIEVQFFDFLNEYKDSFNPHNADKVVSNYLGCFYQPDTNEVISSLAKQLSGSVKWRDNMQNLINKTSNILELGPNRPLRGFFKTMNVDIQSVINIRSANKVFSS